MITESLSQSVEDSIPRMLRKGAIWVLRSSMWVFQVSLASKMNSKYLVFLVMGSLLQASVASMMLDERSEKTTVEDL